MRAIRCFRSRYFSVIVMYLTLEALVIKCYDMIFVSIKSIRLYIQFIVIQNRRSD
jgi:hypothetical protein